MKCVSLGILSLIIFVDAQMKSSDNFISNERKIFHLLLDNYEPSIRPVNDDKDTVQVQFDMSLVSVEDLNEETQILTLHVWIHLEWQDVQLVWNSSEYGGLRAIRLPIARIWIPDITVFNSAMDIHEYAHEPPAVVRNDGRVLWIPMMRLKSHCPLNLEHFPLDEQTCNITFGSWTYSSLLVNLTIEKSEARINEEGDLKNREWIPQLPVVAVRNEKKYECCKETFVDVTYIMKLKRQPFYLVLIFYLPGIALAFLTPVLFLLPPFYGDKITLGVGILICYTLLLVMLAGVIPSSHPTLPIIGAYYVVNMFFVCWSIAVAALVNTAWHTRLAMPTCLRVLTRLLARLTCVRHSPTVPRAEPVSMRRLEHQLVAESEYNVDGQSVSDERAIIDPPRSSSSQSSSLPSVSEWHLLAMALDRIAFVVFFLLAILASMGEH